MIYNMRLKSFSFFPVDLYLLEAQLQTSDVLNLTVLGVVAQKNLWRSDKTFWGTTKIYEHFTSKKIIFLSGFSATNIHDTQDSRGRGRLFL